MTNSLPCHREFRATWQLARPFQYGDLEAPSAELQSRREEIAKLLQKDSSEGHSHYGQDGMGDMTFGVEPDDNTRAYVSITHCAENMTGAKIEKLKALIKETLGIRTLVTQLLSPRLPADAGALGGRARAEA